MWLSGKMEPLRDDPGPALVAHACPAVVGVRGLLTADDTGVERTIGGSKGAKLAGEVGAPACQMDCWRNACEGAWSAGELVVFVDALEARAKECCGFLNGEGSIREDVEGIGKFWKRPCGSLGMEEKS